MEKSTTLGMTLGLFAVGYGMFLTGADPHALINPAAFLIIFAGTFAALLRLSDERHQTFRQTAENHFYRQKNYLQTGNSRTFRFSRQIGQIGGRDGHRENSQRG